MAFTLHLHRDDRDIACQEALEPMFQSVAELAEEGGWSGDEVASALLALAMAHIKGRIGKAAIAHAIQHARASVEDV